LPFSQREVTAILVLTASVGGAPPELLAPGLIKSINKDSVAQAVLPIREMTSLFSTFVDPLRIVLLALTVMIVIVSGIGILVSIYNSMNERQHEIAVIRALGAGRRKVMFLVLLESILLSLGGGLVGWVVGHGLIAALSPWIAVQTGVSIGFLQFVGYELVIIPGMIALASLVGYLPAMAAYRTDVAKALSATP
jgi:putative ABC transport system permease protein